MDNRAVVEMIDICKAFPGVQALDHVSFTLRRGEVHCLLGENGAGKSTLIKILSGAYQMDSGQIKIEGREVNIRSAQDARGMGISTIYQEMNLVPGLSVAENLFLGEEETLKGVSWVVDRRAMNARANEIFAKMNVTVDPNALVGDLNTAKQQMVEIARSLINQRKVIIMDEPTSSITDKDTEELFRIIRELKAQGVSIIYISHRLQELAEIVDRVTVMRDGQYIATFQMGEVSIDELVRCMVGRELEENARAAHGRTQEVLLEARRITAGRAVQDASFQLHRGEILGFAGLVGAGRT
ncbi:sugar ABC transporter ATP-binding protein, partial [Ligaoa zhengdingensis]